MWEGRSLLFLCQKSSQKQKQTSAALLFLKASKLFDGWAGNGLSSSLCHAVCPVSSVPFSAPICAVRRAGSFLPPVPLWLSLPCPQSVMLRCGSLLSSSQPCPLVFNQQSSAAVPWAAQVGEGPGSFLPLQP